MVDRFKAGAARLWPRWSSLVSWMENVGNEFYEFYTVKGDHKSLRRASCSQAIGQFVEFAKKHVDLLCSFCTAIHSQL